MTLDVVPTAPAPTPIIDAWLAARLFAVAPAFAGGILVRGGPGPVRDRWIADLRAMLSPGTPCKSVPVHADDDRLLGGLDLAATLRQGGPVLSPGLLAQADGGVVLLSMAERAREGVASHICAGLDGNRFGVVACDEATGDDAAPAAALLDRLAFHVDLRDISWRDLSSLAPLPPRASLDAAVSRCTAVECSDGIVGALCASASALGIASIRASLHAVRVARLLAALDDAAAVTGAHAASAARLVLGPRALCAPSTSEGADGDASDDPASAPEAEASADDGDGTDDDHTNDDHRDDPDPTDAGAASDPSDPDSASPSNDGQPPASLDDQVLAAATSALPAGLLALAGSLQTRGSRAAAAGRSGALRGSGLRGRPAASRRERARRGARLDLIATLRAAAPWQRLRAKTDSTADGAWRPLLRIRAEDFHTTRFLERGRTTTVFAVDASGSSALHRLAEAKGAVELLLADCYVRRDSVAVIGFRGRVAELLLPPTRSLARAKRSLAELPGGGGTPLASGIDAALALATTLRRRGDTPVVVVLSDGRANIRRDGVADRVAAEAEALVAARALRSAAINALFIDTSPRPQPLAQALAEAMDARYLPLPHAEAATLSAAVRGVTAGHGQGR